MYQAIVCRLKNVRPHSNADRLKCAIAGGCAVIVGLDASEGDLGVLFPEGGCIAASFIEANELGYLGSNGRVKAIKLRGELSFGLWCPVEYVGVWLSAMHVAAGHGERTGVPVLADGDRLSDIKGTTLCEQYVTPATKAAQAANRPKSRTSTADLPRHYDTPQLRDLTSAAVPLHNEVYISEKVHGTSGRTGYVLADRPLGVLARFANRLLPQRWQLKPKRALTHVSGTRNCVLDVGAPGEKGELYRARVHATIAPLLQPGEIWFYEIAGFDTNGRPIMAPQPIGDLGDKQLETRLRKDYGGPVVYDYGCSATGCNGFEGEAPRYRVFVYRIVRDGADLSWPEVVARANAAGFDVPVYRSYIDLTLDEIRELATLETRSDSAYSTKHPREGVCVRIEGPGPSRAYKHKGFVFCALEGIARNDPDYVDTEEAA